MINYQSLLIVEDQIELRKIMTEAVTDAGYLTYDTGSVTKSISILKSEKIDLILLDLELEDGNGIEILKFVRRQNDFIPVMIISNMTNLDMRVNCFKEGSDDFILKPFHIEELIARVHRMSQRLKKLEIENRHLDKELVLGDFTLDYQNVHLKIKDTVIPLRNKLFQMVEYFMKNEGVIIHKQVIYARIWNNESQFDENTLSVHIHQLRKLIDRENKKKSYIQTIHGSGFRFSSTK